MDDWFSHRASDKGKMLVENKTPSDFQFIKTIGEGAFSTVSFSPSPLVVFHVISLALFVFMINH